MKTLFCLIVCLLFVFGGSCFGQNETKAENKNKGCFYVDENKDGICDHRQKPMKQDSTQIRTKLYQDLNNDGKCDNLPDAKQNGTAAPQSQNNRDKNNDGICDYCGKSIASCRGPQKCGYQKRKE